MNIKKFRQITGTDIAIDMSGIVSAKLNESKNCMEVKTKYGGVYLLELGQFRRGGGAHTILGIRGIRAGI